MKLEIKHLAPYLPYGLKGAREVFTADPTKTHTFELSSLNNSKSKSEWDVYWEDERGLCTTNQIKPILRPLSNLKDEANHSFIDKFNNLAIKDKNLDVTLDYCSIEKDFIIDNVLVYGYEVQFINEFLFKNHFDVFSLIKKGLAIDVNTLQKRLIMKNGIPHEKYYFLLQWKDENMEKYMEIKGDRSLCELTTYELNKLYEAIQPETKPKNLGEQFLGFM